MSTCKEQATDHDRRRRMNYTSLRSRLGAIGAVCCVAGLAIVAGTVAALVEPVTKQDDLSKRAAGSRAAVQELGRRLKKELVNAIKSGGPKSAIQVCNVAAPAMAQQVTDTIDGQIGRTALKLRNPNNAPDDWERSVLEMFDDKTRNGADATTLEHFEVVQQNGERKFRYMKAIATAKPCLVCHGPNVDPNLRRTIGSLYPEDEAVGFTLGSLRGAFTVTQPVK
jgi:Protein of unknown function (DUF3365)